jgi:hypothetical protein
MYSGVHAHDDIPCAVVACSRTPQVFLAFPAGRFNFTGKGGAGKMKFFECEFTKG